MPAKNFTARWVKSVKPPTNTDRTDYFDYNHFGKGQGLVLRVRKSGTKSWCVVYIKNGKNRPPYTIGRYPDLSLADAAETGAQILGQLLDKVDPVQARNERNAAPTFEEVAELFLLRYCKDKADFGKRDRAILQRDFIKSWGDEKVTAIRRRDVVAVLDRIEDRGPVAANRAHSCIRKLFNWAIRTEQDENLEDNPATNIDRRKEQARDRALDAAEINLLWPAIDAADMAQEIRLLLKLMLVTGQRKAEWLQAEWSEIDLKGGWWNIPAAHTKNGQAHRVALSPLAVKLLKQARTLHKDSDLVLPSPRTGGQLVDGAIDRAVRNNSFPIDHWTPHDLRRSAATHMGRLGVTRSVMKKILNHVDGDITAVYDRHSYDKEKKAALNKWGGELQQLVGV